MGTINLGKIAFTWKGVYGAGVTYAKQDVAHFNGDSYVSVADGNIGITPGTDTAKWQLFAQGSLSVGVANGDLIYFNGTQLTRLPAGLANQVLKIDLATGLPVWGDDGSRSGVKVKSLHLSPSIYRSGAVIMDDDSVRTWGINGIYKLGIGAHTGSRSNPVRPAFASSFPGASKVYMTPGNGNSYCIDKNGQLWIWGDNAYGACASGNLVAQTIPYNASANASNSIFGKTVVEVAMAESFEGFITSVVRTSDGKVHAAGYNAYGQCGDGSTTNRTTFAELPSVANCVKIVGSRERYGTFHALTASGQVYSWGYGVDGALGNNGVANVTIPTLNAFFNSGSIVISKIAAHPAGLFCISNTGNLYFHGTPHAGSGGTGATAAVLVPTLVSTGVRDAYASCAHAMDGAANNSVSTIIIKNDNTIWGAGQNTLGTLGIGTNSNTSSFTQCSPGFPTNVTKVVMGASGTYQYTALLDATGVVWVAGSNAAGQLGTGDLLDKNTFVKVPIAGRTVVDIAPVGVASEGGLLYLLDDGQLLVSGYGAGDYQCTALLLNCPSPTPIIF
jgi:alpha-tubulin suppressor-like RCC1 family protein